VDGLPAADPSQAAQQAGTATAFYVTRIYDSLNPDGPTRGRFRFADKDYYSLELPWKENQPEISCIPEGEYPCILAWSARFDRFMPHLVNVPNRSEIEIHAGNSTADTRGCILIGTISVPSGIYNSRKAFEEFNSWLAVQSRSGVVTCVITSEPNDSV